MANTFTHIANATEFANIANYIKTNGIEEETIFEAMFENYYHNGMEYQKWDDAEIIIIDGDKATTLYPNGSLRHWDY